VTYILNFGAPVISLESVKLSTGTVYAVVVCRSLSVCPSQDKYNLL